MNQPDAFQTEFRPVPGLDVSVALHPWDAETFGFETGEVKVGPSPVDGEALRTWMSHEGIALLVAHARGEDSVHRRRLHETGFRPVEEAYTVALPRLVKAGLPSSLVELRRARPEERSALEDLASRAFRFGRFHTDPWFPVALARRRMARWVGRAMESEDPADAVLVVESEGGPEGFFHVRHVDGKASLRLGGVDPSRNGGLGGYGLFVETLRWLRDRGARSVTAEIAAANTAVVNVYARLGFLFTRLDVTMHLHSPTAPYLER
ncbi:MAG: hypothetical protein OEO23_02790 [Gemmatimonadota bacterium]|nr:hypothetical protein [Gemmatimonadota bacterium]